MSSDDRELRDALEEAQASLKQTKAELEALRAENQTLGLAAGELERTRLHLSDSQVREKQLEELLSLAAKVAELPGPPVEPPAPPPPPISLTWTKLWAGAWLTAPFFCGACFVYLAFRATSWLRAVGWFSFGLFWLGLLAADLTFEFRARRAKQK